MQFGIGLLGQGWNIEVVRERMRAEEPPRANFALHAGSYAAKVAAETILAESPSRPELDDEALITRLSWCALPPRRSELQMIRDAFLADYAPAPVASTEAEGQTP